MKNKKFRVWHKDLQKYLPAEEWCLDFYGKLIFVEMSSNCKPGDYVKLVAVDPNLYIAEQFTGLYDKNEKEIFEGDIIKFRKKGGIISNDKTYIDFITWKEWQGVYYLIMDKSDIPLNSWNFVFRTFEILGNINQNKELLN